MVRSSFISIDSYELGDIVHLHLVLFVLDLYKERFLFFLLFISSSVF